MVKIFLFAVPESEKFCLRQNYL